MSPGCIPATSIRATDERRPTGPQNGFADDLRSDTVTKPSSGMRQAMAEAPATMPGISIDPDAVETNMVYFEVHDSPRTAQTMCDPLRDRGVRMPAVSPRRVRAVTHLDVSRDDIERAIRKAALPSRFFTVS